MQKLPVYIFLCLLLTGMAGCDKGFEAVNTNPVQPTTLDPGYLFSTAQVNTSIGMYYYSYAIVQQVIHPFTGVPEGGNHNTVNDANANIIFNNYYLGNNSVSGPVVLLTAVLDQTKNNPARSNLYHMARIWRAYVFQVLVDTYGDVPYAEAGKGYLNGINLPKYDAQREIYADLANELTQATQALDASKAIESGDVFYKGNIAQWKKLGYSLLLRLGMRYSKTDPAKAQQLVAAAYAGGTLQSNADNAYVVFNSTFNSPVGSWVQGPEKANVYLGAPFVNTLSATADPRLGVIAVKYTNPGGTLSAGTTGTEDTNPASQQGMPFGYDEATIRNAPGFPGTATAGWKYSQLNRRTIGRIDIPDFFVTFAQTQLLLAEAAQRGWITADPAALYNSAVTADMDRYKLYDASAAISAASVQTYLAANPYNPATALQQLNTQYWIVSFLNGAEAWANFRRSGYPVLAPNAYPGADPAVKGDFIHRLTYPVREASVNTANYTSAVNRIGTDNLATRIFWDQK